MKNIYFALFFVFIIVIGVFVINLQRKEINSLKGEKSVLMANNNLLIDKLKRSYNDQMELSRKNKELEKLAKSDTGFDWYADISNSPVVVKLRENAIRLSGN